MSDLDLTPISQPFNVAFSPPGSKSLTNRALVLAALGEGVSTLSNVLFADDTQVMLDGLGKLGFTIEVNEAGNTAQVTGAGGKIPRATADLFCGNSGTTLRFLTALCCLGHGTYILDGVERMRERPIAQLQAMLRNLGARIYTDYNEGYPPVRLMPRGLPGGIVKFSGAQSSQYLSAVLMVAPYAKHEVRIDLEGKQTSWPYVKMTMQLMDEFGVTVELERVPDTGEPKAIIVPRQRYRATHYAIEPDASNATYFLAAAAISPGSRVTIQGLGRRSLQGDVGFADVLHRMGAGLVFGQDFISITGTDLLQGIDIDLSDMPDTAQTLGVVALFADGPTTLRGLHTLRVKETDRVTALATELQKLGAEVEIDGDDVTITPPERFKPARIDTYNDHRMAMSFAVAGTRVSGVRIHHVECVNKTYPSFWRDLARLAVSSSTKE